MKFLIIPGYEDLFGKAQVTYEKLLSKVPSDLVLRLIISINNELNSGDAFHLNQERIRGIISYRFSVDQIRYLENAFRSYKRKVPLYSNVIFGRRYLLAMFMKELKRNNHCEYNTDDIEDEYNFLLAYFLVIDEVNKEDRKIAQKFKEVKDDEFGKLKIIWHGTMNQYEFNQNVNSGFEIFKLTSFSFFIYTNYKENVKELLRIYQFKNLAEFIASYYQVARISMNIYNSEVLQKLQYINPHEGIDRTHLKSMSINLQKFEEEIKVSHIREFPLYETHDRGFMIIDEDIYRKKIYNGPLFDLYYKTSLKNSITFPTYKSNVSEFYFEKICFRIIFESLFASKHDFFCFDDKSKGYPDSYHRRKKTITIVEFKDYLFPDSLIETDDFEKMIDFLNTKFISNELGKKKAVGQLVSHVGDILMQDVEYDVELLNYRPEQFKIYPVICHTNFMFSMPGVNEYLNQKFQEELLVKDVTNSGIRNVTLISLETIFDIVRLGGDIKKLNSLVDRYWKIIDGRKVKYQNTSDMNDLLKAKISFDEVFDTIFVKDEFGKTVTSNKESVDSMLNKVNFKQEILDEIL